MIDVCDVLTTKVIDFLFAFSFIFVREIERDESSNLLIV